MIAAKLLTGCSCGDIQRFSTNEKYYTPAALCIIIITLAPLPLSGWTFP